MKHPHLASSLRTVISKMHKRLIKQMNTVDNLSLTEVGTLSNLYNHQSLFPSEMAAMVKIKAQSMSQILNHLDELQLISKTPSGSDKRKISISLNAHGRQMVEHTRDERDEWLNKAIETHLSASEKKLLQDAVALLEKLADHQ